MLPKEDKSGYAKAVDALKKRFRSVEIEELKGMGFHRRVQGEESIEQLRMDLQKLVAGHSQPSKARSSTVLKRLSLSSPPPPNGNGN